MGGEDLVQRLRLPHVLRERNYPRPGPAGSPRLGERGRLIGGTVVNDDRLQPIARVVEAVERVEEAGERGGFVAAGDEDDDIGR